MIEHVVVMAAVPDRRISRLTKTRPKAMLTILGRPMIARVMDGYYAAGIRRFTVVVGAHEGTVAEWLTGKWYPDVQLMFVPQAVQRGTASALFAARPLIDGPFIVTSCDVLIPAEHIPQVRGYFDTHPNDAAVLSLLYAPDEVAQSAGVLLDPHGYVIYISERPTSAHQDYMTALSMYGFQPNILDYLDKVPIAGESGERMLTAAIQLMIDDGQFVGAVQAEWRTRIDLPEDLLGVNMRHLAALQAPGLLSDLPTSVQVTPPVYVDPGVKVGANSKLGPNVYVESGSIIGANVTLKDCMVLGAQVRSGEQISNQIVSEDQ